MAVIKALEEWRPECDCAAYPLQLITDYKNLKYIITNKLLNQKQAQPSKFLTRFDYQILSTPGTLTGYPVVLTRRQGNLPDGGDERSKTMTQVVVK
jgi:hypothetical protein